MNDEHDEILEAATQPQVMPAKFKSQPKRNPNPPKTVDEAKQQIAKQHTAMERRAELAKEILPSVNRFADVMDVMVALVLCKDQADKAVQFIIRAHAIGITPQQFYELFKLVV